MGYVVAKYIRLSLDDEHTESCSISTQRFTIDKFISHLKVSQIETLEFIDNGYSGLNYDRPGIKELLKLVNAGKINCIVVKDFSRFGRNMIDTAYYIEQFFPAKKVRFVAINDNYDSFDNVDGLGGINVQFKFLINELYSKEASRKIRNAKAQKAKEGRYVSENCIFGYKLNKDTQKLEIDDDAAKTVRLIYKMAIKGLSTSQIAERLYTEQCPIPSAYKKHKSAPKGNAQLSYIWDTSSILAILRNEQYTGTYLAGKSTGVEVGTKQRLSVDESQWIRIPDLHPEIINKKDYEYVQQIYGRKPKSSKRMKRPLGNNYTPVTSLAKKVFCGCCKHKMHHACSDTSTFKCTYTIHAPDVPCYRLSIEEKKLLNDVFVQLKKQSAEFLESYAANERTAKGIGGIEQPKNDVMNLFEQVMLGNISNSEYVELLKKRRVENAFFSQEVAQAKFDSEMEKSLQLAKNIVRAEEILPEYIEETIEKIFVSYSGEIKIDYKFKGFENNTA